MGGDDGKTFVNYGTPVAEPKKSSKPIFLWLGIIVLVLILLGAIIYFFFINNSGNNSLNENAQGLNDCLKVEEVGSECRALFNDYLSCEGLGDLKDKCLFYTASNTEDYSLCAIIGNSELKTKCEKEVIIFGEDL